MRFVVLENGPSPKLNPGYVPAFNVSSRSNAQIKNNVYMVLFIQLRNAGGRLSFRSRPRYANPSRRRISKNSRARAPRNSGAVSGTSHSRNHYSNDVQRATAIIRSLARVHLPLCHFYPLLPSDGFLRFLRLKRKPQREDFVFHPLAPETW